MILMVLNKRIKLFLITVFLIAFISWTSAAIISQTHEESVFVLPLHLLGGASPLIATIIYLVITKEWKNFFYRFYNFHEVNYIAWAIALSPIIILVSTHLIVFNQFNINIEFKEIGMFYVLFLLFFGPIPEEVGWRGILFNDLNKLSFKKAQFIVMIVWLIWHIPLFFIVGTYQYNIGILSLGFIFFCLNIILQSLIMGYLFLIGNKNILLPILFHYFVNLFGEMFNKNTVSEVISIILYGLLLVTITLTFHRSQQTIDKKTKR